MRFRTIVMLLALVSLGAATVAFASPGRDDEDDDGRHGAPGRLVGHGMWGGSSKHHRRFAVATLMNARGEKIGRVWLKQRRRDGGVWLFARVRDLPPGFHGFHIHATGRCQAPDFTSAGGHLNPTNAGHGDHAGDLPSLLVRREGTGMLATVTDRFSLRDLRDNDGSAVIVHSGRDNFANIPERYGGPDEETLRTGDAGSRLACGEVR
jgi:Cu-Zn family superoxide dismutase